MPIVGVGTDIVEIKRIEEISKKTNRFCQRVFTPAEVEYCNSKGRARYASFAARFAAKEAIAKAIGHPLSWQDVEITATRDGNPCVQLRGRAKELAANAAIHVSLSHAKDYACAVALVEVDPKS
jgi:holo-[acyl-carrier protein] synthase